MAKICTYCGRELADGEDCTCPQSVLLREMEKQKGGAAVPGPAATPTPQPPQRQEAGEQPKAEAAEWGAVPPPGPAPRQPSRVRTAFHNIVPFFIQYWKQPGQAIQTACQHQDLPLALLYLAFFMVCSGVFVAALFQRLAQLFNQVMAMGQSVLESFLGNALGVGNVAIPVLTMWASGAVMALALVFLAAMAIFAAAKVGKAPLNLKNSFVVAALSTLAPALGLLLTTVLLFFTLRGTAYALLFTAMAWLFLTALGAKRAAGNPESGKFQFALLGLLTAAVIAASWLHGQVLEMAAGRISVNGVQLDQAFSPYDNGLGGNSGQFPYDGYGNYGGYGGYGDYADEWGQAESDPFFLP